MRRIFKCCLVCGHLLLVQMGCKKYLEPGERSAVMNGAMVFADERTALAAQSAIYAEMEATLFPYGLIRSTGLSADEFIYYSNASDYVELYRNSLRPGNSLVLTLWSGLYNYIYQSNAVMEAVMRSGRLPLDVVNQLLGESLFVRSFCFYYLVALFGDVPLVRSTDYQVNARLARSRADLVLKMALRDLEAAAAYFREQLQVNGNSFITERGRPGLAAVAALSSRISLMLNDYEHAGKWASLAIDSSGLVLEDSLNRVFRIGSREAIWQLYPVVEGFNSYTGYYLGMATGSRNFSLHTDFMTLFQGNDRRPFSWIEQLDLGGTLCLLPIKYKEGYNSLPPKESTVMLRLAEQYLIRSEAWAMMGDLPASERDLNVIRKRAGITPVNGLSRPALLDSIALERRRELFAEADRWISLGRTGDINIRLSLAKPGSWDATDQLYPIPQVEIARNPSLTQNPGY